MPSDFDAFADAFCVPAMQEAFGERKKHFGTLDALTLHYGDGTTRKLAGVIVGNIETVPSENSAGEWIEREAVRVHVARSQLDSLGISHLSANVQVAVPKYPQAYWHYDSGSSNWGASLVVLGLVRKPIAESRQLRSHGAV